MGRRGRRYLLVCATATVIGTAWIGYLYYRWTVVNWDVQEDGA